MYIKLNAQCKSDTLGLNRKLRLLLCKYTNRQSKVRKRRQETATPNQQDHHFPSRFQQTHTTKTAKNKCQKIEKIRKFLNSPELHKALFRKI